MGKSGNALCSAPGSAMFFMITPTQYKPALMHARAYRTSCDTVLAGECSLASCSLASLSV